jgi:hypothetical protein
MEISSNQGVGGKPIPKIPKRFGKPLEFQKSKGGFPSDKIEKANRKVSFLFFL